MRIKIATIITRMDLGGAQKVVLCLCQNLNLQRFEQVVITGDGGLLLKDLERMSHIHHYIVPELTRRVGIHVFIGDFMAILRIWKILRHEKPDLVHTHTPKAGILGRWAAWLAGVPVIVHTYHGFGFGEGHPVWKRKAFVWIERFTSRISTFVVTVSERSRELGASYGFVNKQRSRTIRAGVDFSLYQQEPASDARVLRQELGLPPSSKIVGVVAGFKPPKSLHHFVEVSRRVHQVRPTIKFLMIGDGELRPMLEAKIHQRKLEGTVLITGWRNDVPALLRLLDVFLLTSQWEGAPLVLVEACLAGVPIVSTNVDGITEIVENGKNGFLVPAGDVDQMSRKILWLIDNEDLRKEMGEKGPSMVGEFSAEKMVRDYESLYTELLQGTARM